MDINTLWSLRLGFSAKQAGMIEKQGIEQFLKNSFAAKPDTALPDFMRGEPKTLEDIKSFRDKIMAPMTNATQVEKKRAVQRQINYINYDLKNWWIDQMVNTEYPLNEKMTLFWHNHYVSTIGKVNVNYWMYDQNMLLRKNALGNFRELTKEIIKTNAMLVYLDNNQNKKGKYNENLSRELLELFTLGVGNYSEQDIKNGAKGLAGLTPDKNGGTYKSRYENNEPFVYFGKTGNFKSDELVDILFQQKSAPFFITRKILKWFIYDNPTEDLVTYYGNYLMQQDYEIKPFLIKIFTEEFNKPNAGSKIKDPLTYYLQLLNELNIKQDNRLTALFIKGQGMDIFNQPNVKGWSGGKYWLTAQLYLQRNKTADQLCKGKNMSKKSLESVSESVNNYTDTLDITLSWNKKGNNKDVIEQLKNRLLFQADENLQKDFENILKYDFNPNGESADNGVLRLFNYMVKTPEFQLI